MSRHMVLAVFLRSNGAFLVDKNHHEIWPPGLYELVKARLHSRYKRAGLEHDTIYEAEITFDSATNRLISIYLNGNRLFNGQSSPSAEKSSDEVSAAQPSDPYCRLFDLAEFVLHRDDSEDWLANARDWYEDYGERTSARRAKAKLALEVFGLIVSKYWKQAVGAIGIPTLWDFIGKMSGK